MMRMMMRVFSMAVLLAVGPIAAQAGEFFSNSFSYQGQLKVDGQPADGDYDFEFEIWDAAFGGNSFGAEVVNEVDVRDGLFTIRVDIGEDIFTGQSRWLAVRVRENEESPWVSVGNRQQVVATPHALVSADAARLGGQTSSFYRNATNIFTGTLNVNRLPTQAARLDMAQTFTAAPRFGSAGAPFSVTSSAQIPNLNASMVGGMTASQLMSGGVSAPLELTGDISGGNVISAVNTASGNASTAINGHSSSSTGSSAAIIGRSDSNTGTGVFGRSVAPSGTTYGVRGTSASDSGRGVFGQALASSGSTVGGQFVATNSPNGRGVFADGSQYGGYLLARESNGVGVFAWANSTTGQTAGLLGQAASNEGRGVYGLATNLSGSNFGVFGEARGSSGVGVYGEAGTTGVQGESDNTTGTGYGGFFRSRSTGGYGVFGVATAGTGTTYGGYFLTNSANGTGVHGFAGNIATGTSKGVYGESSANGGRGVHGKANSGVGVYAESNSTGTNRPALFVTNTNVGGIGMFSRTTSSDANAVFVNRGSGDIVRGFSGPTGGDLVFRVQNNGRTVTRSLQITGGSDLAEPFDVTTADDADVKPIPGMVMVIDESRPGQLTPATSAYDRRVAGVISGANDLAPGMIMTADGNAIVDGAHPVALTGRVWCLCDASTGPIVPGDLLTTSSTAGHAMKVTDHGAAQGAIIGKAMTPLKEGRGLVLLLVSLQ